MNQAARVFDQQNSHPIFRESANTAEVSGKAEQLPWATLCDAAMPPLMFQLRFHDGHMISFAYSDVREIHCRDAGCVQVFLHAMRPKVITVEGRHLVELASLLGSAMVRWLTESDPRDTRKPEAAAEIIRITVEEISD